MEVPGADRVTLSQPDPVAAFVTAVRAAIAEVGDPGRAPAMQGYMKSALPFRGASMPVLRKAVRAVVAGSRRTAEELARAFPGTRVVVSGGTATIGSVPASPALVVATPGAEPLADGGYAAAVLLRHQ